MESNTEYEENRDYEGLTVYDELAATELEDSELEQDVEYTKLRRLSTQFSEQGGVRDD